MNAALLTLTRKKKKGFTLIELIVVVAILAILAAVAIPNFVSLQSRAKQGVDVGNASTIAGAINIYNAMQTADTTKIATGAALAATKTTLGTMWPTGFTGTQEADAWARVTITSYVAKVTTTIT